MTTEDRNPRSTTIDTLTAIEIARLINDEDATVAATIATELPAIAQAMEEIAHAWRNGGRLLYVGAGTSGRLAVLDALECPPTYGTDPQQVQAFLAGGVGALQGAVEDAEDNEASGAETIVRAQLTPRDVVVGVAASGSTPYVVGALRCARELDVLTIAVVGCAPGPVSAQAIIVINPRTGPEVVTGSTRMKAGTAQKMVLTMLTTGAMILSGKTYGNLMVDVKASNIKLRRRAVRIVAEATGLAPDDAAILLDTCAGEVKTAIVATLLDVPPIQARAQLAAAGGIVRRALIQPRLL